MNIEISNLKQLEIEKLGIDFQEDLQEGYAPRTRLNASADVTLAFAIDFNTAGEKLTKRCVIEQGKIYIPIHEVLHKGWASITDAAFRSAVKIKENTDKKEIILNVAGNGIYTVKRQISQDGFDQFVLKFIENMIMYLSNFHIKIRFIRSGGQTGADEAGLKAAVKLGIPAICLAPKGWKFRNQFGQDISDEIKFKERFIC